jgi:Tfp pilus assembly protein PilF
VPVALLYWALSEKQLRHYENAEDLLKRASGLGLDTLHVHLELGNVHLAQGELQLARADYARCLAIDPNNPIVLYNYGLVLRKSGDADGATQSYERAIQIDPHFREPIMELAVLYLHSGRADDALTILRNLQAMDGAALSLRGAAQLQKDNIDEAQKSLEAALRKDRTLTDARMNLAQIYTRRGLHARAARYLESVTVR